MPPKKSTDKSARPLTLLLKRGHKTVFVVAKLNDTIEFVEQRLIAALEDTKEESKRETEEDKTSEDAKIIRLGTQSSKSVNWKDLDKESTLAEVGLVNGQIIAFAFAKEDYNIEEYPPEDD